MSSQQLRIDFFRSSWLIRQFDRIGPWGTFAGVLFTFYLGAIACAEATSHLGTVADLKLIPGDIGRAWGHVVWGRTSATSPAEYPLLRDLPSMVFGVLVAATASLAVVQWRAFGTALPDLADRGTLEARKAREPHGYDPSLRGWQLRRLDRVTRHHLDPLTDDWPLVQLVSRTQAQVDGRRISIPARLAPVAVSVVVGLAVVLACQHGSLFRVIAPRADAQNWADRAYQSWWASSSNLPGVLWYWAFVSFGLYIALMQNFVGVLTVRIVASLPQLSKFRVDWLNTDGHYGWQPIRRAYSSIVTSVSVHAVLLSVLVFVVGFRLRSGVLVPLVIFWTVATVGYLVLIAWTFVNIYENAASTRLANLRQEFDALPDIQSTAESLEREMKWREIADAVRSCGFSATTGSHAARRLLWLSIALPAVLTMVQIAPALLGH